ncbi:DUF11 domain-containing protein [Hymenobacter sp. NST-14]|uniref:T9SS type A sorting domain-containing protein n=1 Tax=Hymenobacter piscis TaxID=2839984 RepID=UPI001C01CF12|nr:T9SS type A sorting domain-containing protein [Hymenobacter piscis]MBT9392067.1 DUF11 domain-containing protein [Hymenobacter piscis]
MKKALRLWVALLLGSSLFAPAGQAQQVTPAPAAVLSDISDLRPPSFRWQQPAPQAVLREARLTGISQPRAARSNPGVARPQAAPTVVNGDFVLPGITNVLFLVDVAPLITNNGGFPIRAYRFVAAPNPAVARVFARNSTTGALREIVAANIPDEILLSNFNQVVAIPSVNDNVSTTFGFRPRNNNGELSTNTSTVTLTVQQVPVAAQLISQIVPAGAPATPLTEPLAVEPGSLAASTYQITSIPTAAQGVLALNGTAVTVNQVITPAQASQLTFDPAAGFFGTAVFNYTARNASGTGGAVASYGIPVARAICGQASTLNFATLADGRSFQTTQSILVEGVTITASNYTAPAGETDLLIFDSQSLPGKTLLWQTDYSSSANNSSSVDFTFSRPLENFSLALADIDQVSGVWTDQLQLDGFTASGQLISLSAADAALAPNNSNNFSSPNRITGQGNLNNFGPNSNVVVTFPQPIVRLRLTYRNTEPIDNPGGQVIGINSMSWCSVVDVYTRFTAGPVAANVGNTVSYTVEYGNNGPDEAQQVTRTVTLPAGATNVTLPAGATYNSTTRVIDFGPAATLASGSSNAFTFGFTVPTTAGSYPVTASTSTPGNENGATANNTATRTLTVSDCNQVSTLNYTTATAGSRKTGTETVNGTTFSYTDYQTAQVTGANVFAVGTSPGILQGQTLVWNQTTTAISGGSAVTLLFDRLTDNLTLTFQDVDADQTTGNFIDNIAFEAYDVATGGTQIPLSSANFSLGAANSFVAPNILRGTQSVGAGNIAGNATIRFTTPIRRLRLVYFNTSNNTTTLRTQNIGINSLSFCAQADLLTTVTPLATPINAGATGQFTVAFTNNGPDAANNVVRQVQLPAGLQNVVASNGGSYNPATGIVTYGAVGSLASGASSNSVITFTSPANGGTVTASSVIGGDARDPNTANNSASGTITVTPVADVTTVVSGPTSVLASQPTGTYTATFSNTGPSAASNVAQTVTLPIGATAVVIPNGATYNPTTRVINFGTAAALGSGATNSYQFSFTAPAAPGTATVVSNTTTATAQGANAAPDQSTLQLTVGGVADVAVLVTAQASPIAAGTQGQFTVEFSNNGPNAATQVVRQVQLPAGLAGVSLPDGGSYDPATGLVTFPEVASLPTGTGSTFRILFTAPGSGEAVTAVGSISTTESEQGSTANNTSAATIAITPAFDLLTRISGPATTVTGTLTTFSIITQNNGPSVAINVGQTAQLPAGLMQVYVSNGGTYDPATGLVTFPALPTLSSGVSVNNTVSFLAPATNFTATAAVTPATGDVNPANNTASAPATTVAAPAAGTANLFTTITANAATVAPGAPLTLTVTQGNDGPGSATEVVQSVSLPAGLVGVVVSDGGTYDSTTGLVTFPAVASQPSGSSTTYTISLPAPASGLVAAVASVASVTTDPMPANNVATTDVRVSPVADVQTALSGPTSATAGQSLTYLVRTTNAGSVAATDVVQRVALPAGLTGVVVSGGGSYDPLSGEVTFPAIALQQPGTSLTNTIQYTAPAAGPLNNVASVSTSSPETMLANNRAAIITSITPVADLTVSLAGPATAVSGNEVTYSVTTTNGGSSAAVNAVTTVQLPTGLTGVVVSGDGSYNATTGIVTFPAVASQPVGSITNTIRFLAPASTQLTLTANVAAENEEVTSNNSATTVTPLSAPTAQTIDLLTTITPSTTTRTPGQPVTFTIRNTNGATSAVAATNVQQLVYLPAGLTGVVVSDGGSYDSTTGIVTFPAVTSQAIGATSPAYTVTVNAPASGSFTATAVVSASQSESNPANNSAASTITVMPQADVATLVTGPASTTPGGAVTYSVVTINNGPSVAAATRQTVQLPANLLNVVVSGGGTYDSASGLVTFPDQSLAPGVANQITNTISFTAPTVAYSVVGAVTTATAESNAGNNTATQNTSLGNQPPVAIEVVNSETTPQGNTADALSLSPLSGRDADGTLAFFTITSLPDANQGVLLFNNQPVTVGQSIPAAQAGELFFDPAAGFTGNAFFTYTVTDDLNATSANARYTIPVGQDVSSLYTAAPVRGGATAYQNNDPIASVFDLNGGAYDATGNVTDNGLTNASTDAAGTAQLTNLGLTLNSTTGLISVQDRTKLAAGTYTIQVTTVDEFGGTNTQPVSFTIGAAPLPVTLVSFSARAVGHDARLNWETAQELNNDHFVVERSLDGRTFANIGRVTGQGTTSSATRYNFTDTGIGRQLQGTVYYRLRQVDTDGTASRTSVQTVAFQTVAPTDVVVYPNPTSGQAPTYLDLKALAAGRYTVTIMDMTGRVVQTLEAEGGSTGELAVAGLPVGSYLVRVQGNGKLFVKPLVKSE